MDLYHISSNLYWLSSSCWWVLRSRLRISLADLLFPLSTAPSWGLLPFLFLAAHTGHPRLLRALSRTVLWNEELHCLQIHSATKLEPQVKVSKGFEFAVVSYSSTKSGLSSLSRIPDRGEALPAALLRLEHSGHPVLRLLLSLGLAEYSWLHAEQIQRNFVPAPWATWSAGLLALCHSARSLQNIGQIQGSIESASLMLWQVFWMTEKGKGCIWMCKWAAKDFGAILHRRQQTTGMAGKCAHSCVDQQMHYDCLSFILNRQTSCLSQHSSPTIPLEGEGRGRGQICHVRLVKCSNAARRAVCISKLCRSLMFFMSACYVLEFYMSQLSDAYLGTAAMLLQ